MGQLGWERGDACVLGDLVEISASGWAQGSDLGPGIFRV